MAAAEGKQLANNAHALGNPYKACGSRYRGLGT